MKHRAHLVLLLWREAAMEDAEQQDELAAQVAEVEKLALGVAGLL